MSLSFWKFLHFSLALLCSIFLVIASVTGIILAGNSFINNITHKTSFQNISIAQTLENIEKNYDAIHSIEINELGVLLNGTKDKTEIQAYIDPTNGAIIGNPPVYSKFISWIKTLHRSLFLHDFGRMIMGITSILLFFISITGFFLVYRQKNWKVVKKPKNNTSFFYYYHSLWGQFFLFPILIISLTGGYLYINRRITPSIIESSPSFEMPLKEPTKKASTFALFNELKLNEISYIEFPFSDDIDDFYRVKSKNMDFILNPFSGEILYQKPLSNYQKGLYWAEILHLGKTNSLWILILMSTCFAILFFIYSGFFITFKRKKNTYTNVFNANNAEFILLFGSENGSTFNFINTVYKQLINQNQKVFIDELNRYKHYPQAKWLLIFTSTYGNGTSPYNASDFNHRLKTFTQNNSISYSIVGFGSKNYPKFCQFALDIDSWLSEQPWAYRKIQTQFINNQSIDDFIKWISLWNKISEIFLETNPNHYNFTSKNTIRIKVLKKTNLHNGIFSLILSTPYSFSSGDILSIFPKKNTQRLYSIGKVNKNIQLIVRLHPNGLGSNFLYNLKENEYFNGLILKNHRFQIPKTRKNIILICNGTGIAPFLGMIQENDNPQKFLYVGMRHLSDFKQYEDFLNQQIHLNKLHKYETIFSANPKEGYVTELIKKDIQFIINSLQNSGVIMLCGSLKMYNDIEFFIIQHLKEKNELDFYKNNNQWLYDCY